MSGIDLYLTLARDSENTYPGRAEVSVEGGKLVIGLRDPDRTIAFDLRTMKRAIATLEDDGGAS